MATNSKFGSIGKIIFFFILSIFALIFLAATGIYSNPQTPAGHEGYVFEQPAIFGKGGYRGSVQGPGNYGISFWRNRVINIDVSRHSFFIMCITHASR